MKFTQQLLFYSLWLGTGILAINYIYTAIFKGGGSNPVFMKQVFGLVSVIVLFGLYKAYEAGEIRGDLIGGIKLVLLSWAPYFMVLIGYIILAKVQGRL